MLKDTLLGAWTKLGALVFRPKEEGNKVMLALRGLKPYSSGWQEDFFNVRILGLPKHRVLAKEFS